MTPELCAATRLPVRSAGLAAVSALLLMVLGGCGGGGTDAASATAPTMATGVVMKGPLTAATVQLFAVDDFGAASGQALATVTTDANGAFTFSRPSGNAALLAVTRGGSFVDEADTETDPTRKRRIALSNEQGFESLLPSGSNRLIITPYTQALLLRARRLSGGGAFAKAFAALRAQSQTAMGFDPADTVPEPPLNPAAGASTAAKQYAMAIGGAAQVIEAQALALGTLPTFETVNAFINDLSDGVIDGRLDGAPVSVAVRDKSTNLPTDIRLNEQIQRFRNNQFAAYQGVAVVAVNETALSQAPAGFVVASADSIAVTEGGTSTVLVGGATSVLANDSPANVGLTARLETNVSQGALVLNSNGSFSYTHNGSETTADSFSYTASNGTIRSAPVTVSITIAPVNDAPVAVDDSYSVQGRGGLTVSAAQGLLANDSDADGPSLTAVVLTQPSNGILSANADGSFTYAPNPGFTGTDSFTYRANDGSLNSNTATVSLIRPDAAGKEFWLGFMQNFGGNPQLSLFIASATDTSGTISIPGLADPFSKPFTVTGGTVTTVSIPTDAQVGDNNTVGNKGINVKSNSPVSVYGLNRIQATTDGYLGLPLDALGTDYFVLGWGPGAGRSEYLIVATENGTTVTITPSPLDPDSTSAPATLSLEAGQTFRHNSGGDVTGTRIVASAPVAVYGGNECANIPSTDFAACDHVVEQLPPISAWGKTFLTQPLATRRNGDTFSVLASEDGTQFTINGGTPILLDRGEVDTRNITGQSVIQSNKPVLVSQFSNGTTFDNVTSDPFMMLIPPSQQFLRSYTFSTPATGFSLNFINLVVANEAINSTLLDGLPVASNNFTAIGNSGFSGASISIGLGTHSTSSSQPFGVYIYGFDQADSYGYPGGQSLGITP